jgi:hypothetical protein
LGSPFRHCEGNPLLPEAISLTMLEIASSGKTPHSQ